jgi:hypothetical protein
MKNELDIFYKLWFPKNAKSITIVAPPSSERLPGAKLGHPNYTQLDGLDDRDTIYHIGKLLARKYLTAEIHLKCSKNFDSHNLNDNLVIIGGPGGDYRKKGLKGGNSVCRIFSKKINSNIFYKEINKDEFSIIVNNQEFKSISNDEGITIDYGYFSAFQNPMESSKRVIILHGIHTVGVLGAKKIFDAEENKSKNNLQTIGDLFKTQPYNFETFFQVDVLVGGIVSCPTFNTNSIYFWNNEEVSQFNKIGQVKINGLGKSPTGNQVI